MLKILLTWARGSRRFPALMVLIPLLSIATFAQEKENTSSAPTPKDLMIRAASQNGLMGEGMPPWHLRASFEEYGDDGKVSDTGTFEEFWASETKFKRIFSGDGFSSTRYGTPTGDFQSGVRGNVPLLLEEARMEFSAPMPAVGLAANGSFDLKEIETNGIKLECLRSNGMPINPDRTYCVGADKPFLRITTSATQQVQILHNRILGFHDRFIAGDLEFLVAGKRKMTAHLETIEPLGSVDDSLFRPPADATSVPKTLPINLVNISAAVAQGMLLRKVAPAYPPFALRERISGVVVLEAMISKEGHIVDLKVVSGPSELREASLEAVHQWLYRPFLLNGQPVSVRTTINVIFTLSQ